jgi:hypothetical protein
MTTFTDGNSKIINKHLLNCNRFNAAQLDQAAGTITSIASKSFNPSFLFISFVKVSFTYVS